MPLKRSSLLTFFLVALLHLGVLAAVLMMPSPPQPMAVEPPAIQGVIVMMEPAPEPQPTPPVEPPPPPEPKPQPKPKPKPLPKAPPSPRAVKAPEPPPPMPVVEKPAKPTPVESPPAPIVPPTTDTSNFNNPAPVYPQLSRRLKEQGTVLLEVLVKSDGTIGKLRVKESSGHKRLDEVALRTVRRWHFLPAKQAGIAIDYWYEIPVEFNLRR